MQLGGGRAANFTLRGGSRDHKYRNIASWEGNARYIKLAKRFTQRNSYLAVNKYGHVSRVSKREKATDTWLHFKLEKVKISECNKSGVYFGPSFHSTQAKLLAPIEDNEEIDFEYEFEQISDSEGESSDSECACNI